MNAVFLPKKSHIDVVIVAMLVIVAMILSYQFFLGKSGVYSYNDEAENLILLKDSNKKRVTRNVKVEIAVDDLKDNTSSDNGKSSELIEEQARYHFNLIRTGEVIYRVNAE